MKEHDFTKVNLPSKINKSNKKNYLKENKYFDIDNKGMPDIFNISQDGENEEINDVWYPLLNILY